MEDDIIPATALAYESAAEKLIGSTTLVIKSIGVAFMLETTPLKGVVTAVADGVINP